ncbi:MAG: alpha/beta hydrolase, partial [Gaiellales bacterium]
KPYVERARLAPPPDDVPLAALRAGLLAELPESWGVPEDVDEVVDILIPGPGGDLPVRVYRPHSTGLLPGLVWFHGGGWVVGDFDTHDPVCRAIANRGPCVVVAVDYRLAPEHPFPAALEDSWVATEWVAEEALSLGMDATRIAVGGDSAGGNLAAAVSLHARRGALPVALQVLVYPVTDYDLDSESYERLGTGLNLTREKMAWYWSQYLGTDDGRHQDASPLRADDLSDVARALVLTAEFDPLLAEGEAYAEALRAAGVEVTATRFDGMIHGFIRMPALVDDAERAIDEIAAALRAL